MAVLQRLACVLLSTAILVSPSWAAKKKHKKASGSSSEITQLRHAVNVLTTKVRRLESRPVEEPVVISQTPHPDYGHTPNQTPHFPKGYIPIPGTNSAVQLGGYIRLDAFHDFGPTVGDDMAPQSLPLRGISTSSSRTGFNRMHARYTQLSVSTLSQTSCGDLKTEVKIDFASSINTPTTAYDIDIGTNEVKSSGYIPRLYYAYADWAGFKVGQTWTLLFDYPSYGYPLDYQGPTATTQLRRPVIVYYHHMNNFTAAGGIENSISDYVDENNITFADNSSISQSQSSSDLIRGFQNLPDLVAAVIYDNKKGMHFAARGVLRQITVKGVTSSRQSKLGYGIVLSTKITTDQRGSNFHGQILGGNGMGMYIDAIPGYSAIHSSTSLLMKLIFSWGYNVGYRQFWADKWSSDFSVSQVRIRLPNGFFNAFNNNPVSTSFGDPVNVSNNLVQLLANIVYNPIEKVDLGFEWGYMRRVTNTGFKGFGNRLLFVARYKFN